MDRAVTGIVLSGGQGRRVGGADKGLLAWHGRTRIEAVLEVFAPQVDDLVISANRNLARYKRLSPKVVCDDLADYQGPLAGIAAALKVTDTELAVVAPCDCPDPSPDLVERLLGVLLNQAYDLVYAHDGNRGQYLFCALRTSCLESLEDYLRDGGRSVKGWHLHLNCGVADFSDCPEHFANHNRRQPSSRVSDTNPEA